VSIESVRTFFAERGLDYPILEFAESSATVELAARALGVEPELIAKTLAFSAGGVPMLVLAKGDARIDNRKFKDVFGVKAKMLPPDEVLAITGHPVGGVCPFGLANPVDVYLDVSLQAFEFVFPAAGGGNTAVKIAPAVLQEITGARWVDVCRGE
jgi:prolyl-tRNA editing enzyme YbaK/EbsC (Cys-tRNA(Pro) deacylase)